MRKPFLLQAVSLASLAAAAGCAAASSTPSPSPAEKAAEKRAKEAEEARATEEREALRIAAVESLVERTWPEVSPGDRMAELAYGVPRSVECVELYELEDPDCLCLTEFDTRGITRFKTITVDCGLLAVPGERCIWYSRPYDLGGPYSLETVRIGGSGLIE